MVQVELCHVLREAEDTDCQGEKEVQALHDTVRYMVRRLAVQELCVQPPCHPP